MKRLTLIWLTMLALLTQGWSAAAMASAVTPPAQAGAVAAMTGMEHCARHAQNAASPAPASTEKSGDCCGAALDCHCVSACGGAALLPALVAFSQPHSASLIPAPATAGFGAAPAAYPFRPPIL